ncbi:MAG: RsmB/NOP family class I SAM-dependent RNA methyltransferase [Clostridium sp.]|nr:RsmB/NOP family class I SAM-dependent RNA methyltransferase [Clostridium sp.]
MDLNRLSVEFLNKMKILLGEEYEAYLDSFAEEPVYGLRVNTLKVTVEEFLRKAADAGWELQPVPWVSNGFYYPKEKRPARHPWYYSGLYYLQEPSAMTPASRLPIEPGDKVLDLCAAPGGKSTELAARLSGTGLLFSNDISNSRAKALLKNLELFGAGNICVSSEPPEKLAKVFPAFFDKILVDAPCSGEGMFRRDPDMVKSYEEKGPEYYAPIQREIAAAAVQMLAPGGMLLYSTCTFDEEEDEGTIRYLLEEFPDLSLVPLEKSDGFAPGIGMPECVCLFPHKVKGEGHFLALLKKNEEGPGETARTQVSSSLGQKTVLPNAAEAFLREITEEWEKDRFYQVKDQLYYLPAPFGGAGKERLRGIRCLRTGLLLGEMRKDRFEPSQALAMWLNKETYPAILSLRSEAAGEDRILRYLKGETLTLAENEELALAKALSGAKGCGAWCLVAVDGYPLGWAKKQNQSLKNKYYPGWRWQ